jgi:hypothetical protein
MKLESDASVEPVRTLVIEFVVLWMNVALLAKDQVAPEFTVQEPWFSNVPLIVRSVPVPLESANAAEIVSCPPAAIVVSSMLREEELVIECPLRTVIALLLLDGAATAAIQLVPSNCCQFAAVLQVPEAALLRKSPTTCDKLIGEVENDARAAKTIAFFIGNSTHLLRQLLAEGLNAT